MEAHVVKIKLQKMTICICERDLIVPSFIAIYENKAKIVVSSAVVLSMFLCKTFIFRDILEVSYKTNIFKVVQNHTKSYFFVTVTVLMWMRMQWSRGQR